MYPVNAECKRGEMLKTSGPAKRIALLSAFVAGFLFINYKLFIAPHRKSAFGFGTRPSGSPVGRTIPATNPNDPNHGKLPEYEFDPRAALSDNLLLEEFFMPGYNLTKSVLSN